MAILRSDEIRAMNLDELKAKLRELRAELARERSVAAGGGSLENPARSRELRRTIARILTKIREIQR